jgi:hypothetical protein
MNIIRLNWSCLLKLFSLVVLVTLVKQIYDKLVCTRPSTLKYNPVKREFFILGQDLDARKRLDSEVFKHFTKKNDDDNTYVVELKSAQFPFHRVPLQNWYRYCEYVKKLGLNAIQIDIIWNVHEPFEQTFDFTTGSNDLEEFIKLVDYFGLFLLVRIDPYLHCSDYDLGGLPSWLLATDQSKFNQTKGLNVNRSILNLTDIGFRHSYELYLNKLISILANHQYSKGGPIIALLVQYNNGHEIREEANSSHAADTSTSIYRFYASEQSLDLVKRVLYKNSFYEAVLKTVSVCEYDRRIDGVNYKLYCDPSLSIYTPLSFQNYASSDSPANCQGINRSPNPLETHI